MKPWEPTLGWSMRQPIFWLPVIWGAVVSFAMLCLLVQIVAGDPSPAGLVVAAGDGALIAFAVTRIFHDARVSRRLLRLERVRGLSVYIDQTGGRRVAMLAGKHFAAVLDLPEDLDEAAPADVFCYVACELGLAVETMTPVGGDE